MALNTYDPKQVVVTLNGMRLQGFSEDSMVKVTFTSPVFETVAGADGKTTRVRIHDDRAVVTVSLMQSSDGNKILSSMLNRDKATPNGAGVGTLMIADLSGQVLIHSDTAWIKGRPEMEFGKKVNARSWEIEASDVTIEDTANETQ